MTEREEVLFRISNAMDDKHSGLDFWAASFVLSIAWGQSTEKTANEIVAFRSRPGIVALPKEPVAERIKE